MDNEVLRIFLPSFVAIFICITFFWKWFRKAVRAEQFRDIEKLATYPRLKRINSFYQWILVIFSVMTIIYTFFPDLYYIFVPLDRFDHPIINGAGLLLLKVALIWMVVAQLHIDKELYKYSRKIEDLKLMELVHFSEKMFLGGLTLMFFGMFVTITNVVGIVMGAAAIMFYYRSIYKYKV